MNNGSVMNSDHRPGTCWLFSRHVEHETQNCFE